VLLGSSFWLLFLGESRGPSSSSSSVMSSSALSQMAFDVFVRVPLSIARLQKLYRHFTYAESCILPSLTNPRRIAFICVEQPDSQHFGLMF
jgi:hypothetical protein